LADSNSNLIKLRAELCFAVDNYNKPKVLQGIDAKTSRFLKLLYMKPGTIPSSPNMGVNITSYKFNFMNDDLTIQLKVKIEEQVSQYLPELNISDMIITPYKGYLIVAVEEYDDVTKKTKNIGLLINQEPTLAQIISR
jgi:hypothetical protein